jgi:hypothetical protein
MFARLLPVIIVAVAAVAYVVAVEGTDPLAVANAVPILVVIALAVLTLRRGRGRWSGNGWQWPLGTLGFAIPAVGLTLYVHHAWSVDLDGLASEARDPRNLFRYLPIYTLFAGGIGFAIGWIAGRNV